MRKPRIGIVLSRFNEEVTSRLLSSCVKHLKRRGVSASRILTVEVPGAYEVPWAARRMASSRRYDVVICLGCVLKGRTPQNDYISLATYINLQRVSMETGVPCIMGVLTPRTWGQAMARTRGSMDRGKEYALAALEMAALKAGR